MGFFSKTAEQPTVIDTEVGQRSTLTFSVEGLAAREELLFKGYVRLLDHLTEHQWQYREASVLHRVDLLVASEQVQPSRVLQAAGGPQLLLQLGITNTSGSPFFLTWPLKPNELENQLNHLGRLICAGVANGEAKAVAVPIALNVDTPSSGPSVRHYRLSLWPKPMLLAEPGRMRLATLLTAKAMSLEEIVFRSALAPAVCKRFLADMQTAGLILYPDAKTSQGPAWVPPAVVKPRLSAEQERQAVLTPSKPVVQPGLIARIRMRLGIKSPGTH